MTCGTPDAVSSFCKYCSTLEKVWETANITKFVVGLDPLLGSRICEHITNIVNSDTDITEYRRTLDIYHLPRIYQLYLTQCEWYRELTHVQTVTGDMSPPPTLHVTDISLNDYSDSDTVRLTEELICSPHNTIVSVMLWNVHPPLHGVVQSLPKCQNLSALCINNISNTENLVSVIPRLTQLTTVRYDGLLSVAADRAAVAAVMSLTQLVQVELAWVSLVDDAPEVTDAMTRLRTVVLHCVYMTAKGWDIFVTSLLTLPKSVSVQLHNTNIDEGTVRRILTSSRITISRDYVRNKYSQYERLQFTTQTSKFRVLWSPARQQIWPRSRSKVTVKVTTWYHRKGLVTRNTHAKYQSSILNSAKVMAKVKVFVTDGQTDRGTDGRTNEI